MQYRFELKSPLHIGSGTTYSEAEFVVKGQEVWRIDINKIFTKLTDIQRNEFVLQLERPDFSLGSFLERYKISLEEGIEYKIPFTGTPPSKEIYECIKTKKHSFLPGSSLKGAIRTAVFYALIEEQDIIAFDRIFSNRDHRSRHRDLENYIDQVFSQTSRKAANYDFLKFLQITDSKADGGLIVSPIKSIEAKPPPARSYGWYGRGQTPLEIFMEAQDVGTTFTGDLHLTYEAETFRALKLGDRDYFLEAPNLLNTIYTFSKDLIQHELQFARNYNVPFLLKFYEQLAPENTPQTPLLKLGTGSGFLATTVNLKLKKDRPTFEKVRRSLRGRSYEYEFPKTRRIAMQRQMPMGWGKLTLS